MIYILGIVALGVVFFGGLLFAFLPTSYKRSRLLVSSKKIHEIPSQSLSSFTVSSNKEGHLELLKGAMKFEIREVDESKIHLEGSVESSSKWDLIRKDYQHHIEQNLLFISEML